MRSRHFALVATALALTVLATAPAQARKTIDGSGKLETRTLDLPAFTKLDLGGNFQVEVDFGKTQQVEVTVDDNLWDNLDADVSSGRLSLSWKKNCKPSDHCTAKITVTDLDEFNLHGAGDIAMHGYRGKDLTFYVRGAGSAKLDGIVEDLDIIITGAGDCDARDLKAKNVKVTVSGVGDCEVYASDSIEARVSGVGNIDYWGKPGTARTRRSRAWGTSAPADPANRAEIVCTTTGDAAARRLDG